MADWKSRKDISRQREKEDAADVQIRENIQKNRKGKIPQPPARGPGLDSEGLMQRVDEASIMIEQINNLYGMYVSGAEKRPPLEKREQLEKIMRQIQSASKNSTALRFKSNSLQTKYLTYRERWDRMMKKFESTKRRA